MHKFITIIHDIYHFGIAYLLSYFIKVYWSQDEILSNGKFTNDGYEIMSLRKPQRYYFYGIIYQWREKF